MPMTLEHGATSSSRLSGANVGNELLGVRPPVWERRSRMVSLVVGVEGHQGVLWLVLLEGAGPAREGEGGGHARRVTPQACPQAAARSSRPPLVRGTPAGPGPPVPLSTAAAVLWQHLARLL